MNAPDIHLLHIAASQAENAWAAALQLTYGRKANDARYDAGKCRATPELAELWDAKSRAYEAFTDAAGYTGEAS